MTKAEVYWVMKVPVRLAVLPRPRGGDWIDDEIASLHAQGLDVLVSLLTEAEQAELDLGDEARACALHDVRFISFPIEDRSIPADVETATYLVQTLRRSLTNGEGVGIHCRMGIGRSATIAAAVLTGLGYTSNAAFARIQAARGCEVPDTPEQRAWVEQFAQEDTP